MEFYQDDDWLEEEPEEVYDNEIEYLYGDDEADASDQILLDQNSLRRMDSEWEPSETEDDAAVDEAVDPIFPYIGDVQENAYDLDAPISTATLLAQLDEVSVERRTRVAQTQAEFDELIKELDRLDRNRERRERYHEILQEEYIPQGGEIYSGRIFPADLDSPESKMILQGMFLDLFYNCPYEMHQLTADPFLSRIVDELSNLHKETLYLLSLQYLSTSQLARMRDQSDRNIRKLRDSYTKKLQKQLYGHLLQKKQSGAGLTFREKEFLTQYELALEDSGTANVKVKKENKYPKRIRKTGAASSTGTEVGVAV